MNVTQSKLSYIANYRSGLEIELQTGVSMFNQNAILSGGIKPTSEEQQMIRNMYQRTAYANLREAGMPYHQARRYSWQMPKPVEKLVAHTTSVIEQLAQYATAERVAILDTQGISYDIMDIYSDMYESVYHGIQTSHESAEAWDEYIAKIERGIG